MAELIREGTGSDFPALETLYPSAFPDEDLLPVLRALFAGDFELLSLVAEADGAVVGHVLFTLARVGGSDTKVAMLAPLAVSPDRQKQGVGSALVRDAFDRLAADGVTHVYVLGDPAYYGRFGFAPERGVLTPQPIPEEWRDAWQSITLAAGGPELSGPLVLPGPWNAPELWAPPE
jgi:putative acetyltransferase